MSATRNYSWNYEYTEIGENESQYANDDLNAEYVDAKYIHSAAHAGNPLIEALPVPLSPKYIMDNLCSVKPYSHGFVEKMSKSERVSNICAIKNTVREPMQYMHEISVKIYECMVDSYANRRMLYNSETCTPGKIAGKDVDISSKTVMMHNGKPTGACLLAPSGYGKTTAVTLVLSRIPQVIRHTISNDHIEYQIPYIRIDCTAAGDFKTFYDSIARAVDDALINLQSTYEENCHRKRTVNEKRAYVESLICNFKIGLLVLDEIQQINAKNDTWNTFLTLMNNTGINIFAIGTEEAKKVFGISPWIATRLGMENQVLISALDDIRNNKAINKSRSLMWFDHTVHSIMKYQYCHSRIPSSPDDDAKIRYILMQASQCSVGVFVMMFCRLQLDVLEREYSANGNKLNDRMPVVDEIFVRKSLSRHFESFMALVDQFANDAKAYEKASRSLISSNERELERMKRQAEEERIAAALSSQELNSMKRERLANVLAGFENLRDTFGMKKYTSKIVSKAFESVWKTSSTVNENEFMTEVVRVADEMIKSGNTKGAT